MLLVVILARMSFFTVDATEFVYVTQFGMPVVTSIESPSKKRKVSGVPQLWQKCRSAADELWKLAGSPRVQTKQDDVTLQKAANGPPTAFWHMRQWQMVDSGASNNAYRTAPHWQPPVIVGLVLYIGLSLVRYRLRKKLPNSPATGCDGKFLPVQ